MGLIDFTPYTQFLAAFYLSLAIESVINRFFLTAYQKRVEELCNSVKNQFNLSVVEINQLNERLNWRRDIVLKSTKRISYCSLFVCLALLVLAGVERSYPPSLCCCRSNTWLGAWWLVVLLIITLPAIFCLGYSYYYSEIKLTRLKKKCDDISISIAKNLTLYISRKSTSCDSWFKDDILSHLQDHDFINTKELLEKVKSSSSSKAFKSVLKKI